MFMRLIIGVPAGALVTLMLFTVMRLLIVGERNLIEEVVEVPPIEITRAERDEETVTDDRAQRPDEQDQPPPPPPMDTRTQRPDLGGFEVSLPSIDSSIGDLGNVGPIDGEIQPLVRVPPEYPIRAQERGLEGVSCAVFTVTPEGTVTDAQIYESTSSIFDRAALRAIARFRYQPRIVNGEPVPRPNVRFCFEFRLANEGRR